MQVFTLLCPWLKPPLTPRRKKKFWVQGGKRALTEWKVLLSFISNWTQNEMILQDSSQVTDKDQAKSSPNPDAAICVTSLAEVLCNGLSSWKHSSESPTHCLSLFKWHWSCRCFVVPSQLLPYGTGFTNDGTIHTFLTVGSYLPHSKKYWSVTESV